jgi:hypothetical protein
MTDADNGPPPDVVAAAATVQNWLDKQPPGAAVAPVPTMSAAERFRTTPRAAGPTPRAPDFRHPAPIVKPN